MKQYVDISVPISPEMLTWSSHEPVSLEQRTGLHDGAQYRVTALKMGTHTGTHVDSPYHFSISEQTVDQLSLEALIGPAQVLELRGLTEISVAELKAAGAGAAPRVLLRTDNSQWVRHGPMPERPAYLTEEAAKYLVSLGVVLVGTDGLTVDHPESCQAHLVLLKAGVIILETLDLAKVEAGEYELICLPLRIEGGDGAPARAVLRRG
jgi:arylformamidase